MVLVAGHHVTVDGVGQRTERKRSISNALARGRSRCVQGDLRAAKLDVPGQQRLIVVDRLRQRQFFERGGEVAVGLDFVGFGRFDQRVAGMCSSSAADAAT